MNVSASLCFLLLGLALATPSCGFKKSAAPSQADAAAAQSGEKAPAAARKETLLVRVRPLLRGVIERRLEATANVDSLNVVDVIPERAEPVVEIFVEEGDRVKAGQELARLRSEQVDLSRRDAEVRLAETKLGTLQAQRDFERNQRLWQEGGNTPRLIAEQVLETSRQAWDSAKAAEAGAQVTLDRAAWDLTRCTLRSPIAGIVTLRDLSLGDMATVGQRAFQIADLSRPKLIFYRPQRELVSLMGGQPVTATSEALPGISIPGLIERIAPVVDANTGTIKVVAGLNPGELVLPTGILMRLTVVLERREQALLVPKEALLYEGGGAYVFVLREGHARRILIVPGFEDAKHLEAAAETALSEGEFLVVVGGDRLADGDEVEVAKE